MSRTLARLNEFYPLDKYTKHNILFQYYQAPPEEMLDYIEDYLNLPFSELQAHGFSDAPGFPKTSTATRLMKHIRRGIHFYKTSEISLYHDLMTFLSAHDVISLYQPFELYYLRNTVYAIYKKYTRLLSEPHLQRTSKKYMDQTHQLFIAFLHNIDRTLLDDNINSIMSPHELDEALGADVDRFGKQFDAYACDMHAPTEFSETHHRDALLTYLTNHLGTPSFICHIESYFHTLQQLQRKTIEDHLSAMVYAILLKKMVAHAQAATPAKQPFWIRETIRTFHPPHTRFSESPPEYRIYPAMDVNKIIKYNANKNNTMNEQEWIEWFTATVSSQISLYDSREWHEIIEMGEKLYGGDPLAAMQHEYEELKIARSEEELKGITPLEVHGTIRNLQHVEIPVVIYGEVHNRIDNHFYKKKSFDEMRHTNIWVEHAMQYCALKPGEDVLFKNAKGSEWVWFHRVKKGLPVTCIDNRMFLGLPNALMENVLRFVAGLPTSMVPAIDAATRKMVQEGHFEDLYTTMTQIVKPILSILSKLVKQKFGKNTYILERFSRKINKQYQEIMGMYERNEEPVYLTVHGAPTTLFHLQFQHMVTNLLNISSIVVDLHIINLLKEYADSKPIAIFTGMNHAFRLADMLNWEMIPNDTVDIPMFEEMAENTMVVQHYTVTQENRAAQRALQDENEIAPLQNARNARNEQNEQREANNKTYSPLPVANQVLLHAQNRNKQLRKSQKLSTKSSILKRQNVEKKKSTRKRVSK